MQRRFESFGGMCKLSLKMQIALAAYAESLNLPRVRLQLLETLYKRVECYRGICEKYLLRRLPFKWCYNPYEPRDFTTTHYVIV